jgi:signal transduction histidine kinase/ActR/RegA family two-component response regulator
MSGAETLSRRWSIGSHLTWVVLLALVPALIIQYASNLERRNDAKVRAQEHLLQLVTQLANQQEQVTASTRQMLTTLSLLPELRSNDTKAFSGILEALHKEDSRFITLFALDADGNLIASAIPFTTLSLRDRSYFKRAVETRHFTVGEYAVGRKTGAPSLHFSLPVMDSQGRLTAVLAAAYSLDHYTELFGSPEVPSNTSTVVVDHEGTVMYRSGRAASHGPPVGMRLPLPQLQQVLGSSAEGTFWDTRQDGVATLFAFRQVRTSSQTKPYVSILVGRTESDVLGESLKADRKNMLLLLATGVCALVAARAIGNWVIAAPIRQLVHASRQIGWGSLSQPPELRAASREVAQLGEELWMTSQALAKREEEQRKTEEVLRNSQRLESLGVLTGGIAHEFNNLLSAMLGNLNLTQTRLSPDHPGQRTLALAEKAVQRATELTRQMLAYSGQVHFVVKPLDLNLAVHEISHLLRVTLSKQAILRLDLAPELPAILADAAQIQQVMLNLVTNASEALGSNKGSIILRTRTEDLDQQELAAFCPGQDLEPGNYVTLEVADTGCGMGPDLLERIFDPFFTTKPMGHGLGLSAMHGILRTHHAGIHIQSAPGSGSTFTILFPAAIASPLMLAEEYDRQGQSFQGLALVADDEPLILEFVTDALESMGFEVIQAEDGHEAVTRFLEHPQEIRLAILDFTMPRMNGIEVFNELRAHQPTLPVILSSGYDPEAAVRGLMDQGQAWFLPKPYLMKELRRVVCEAMAATQQSLTRPGQPNPSA